MLYRSLLCLTALAALSMSTVGAQVLDYAKYPDLKGQWTRFVVRGLGGQASFDQTKPWGLGQEAPLTPEYKAIEEASLADQANGGHGNNYDHVRCVAAGMPRMMIAFRPLEFVITPDTTYILVGDQDQPRRIFTDGRDWPKAVEPTFRATPSAGGSRMPVTPLRRAQSRPADLGPRVYAPPACLFAL